MKYYNEGTQKQMMVEDRAIAMISPMVDEYLRILRNHGFSYPRREWSRNGSGHKVNISFWVDMIMLRNGIESPGPIMVAIKIDGELTCKLRIGYNAGFLMLDGIKLNTPVEVEIRGDSEWLIILDRHIEYLLREAKLG